MILLVRRWVLSMSHIDIYAVDSIHCTTVQDWTGAYVIYVCIFTEDFMSGWDLGHLKSCVLICILHLVNNEYILWMSQVCLIDMELIASIGRSWAV